MKIAEIMEFMEHHGIMVNYVISWNVQHKTTGKYCNYKGKPCHKNMFPYRDIISCHNMSLNQFLRVY